MPDTKSPVPIKTELFHFVTARTPQLLSDEKRARGFIVHPEPTASYFLKELPGTNVEADRAAVRERVDGFHDALSRDQIRSAAPAVYALSQWLSQNRDRLAGGVLPRPEARREPLPHQLLLKIWDTLFVQLLRRTDAPLRQLCIQMIIAANFVDKAKPDEANPPDTAGSGERLALLRRLANAKVVVPRAFSVKRQSFEGKKDRKLIVDITPAHIDLSNQHVLAASDLRADNYDKVRQEIRVGIHSLATPQKDLAALAAASGDTQAHLSRETRAFLASNPTQGVSLRAAEELIDDKIRGDRRRTRRIINASPGLGSAQASQGLTPYRFVVSLDRVEGQLELLMTMYTGYAGAFPRTSEFELSFRGSPPVRSEAATRLDTPKPNNMMLKLFPDQDIPDVPHSIFFLTGRLALNNGDTLRLEVEGPTNAIVLHGQATVLSDGPADEPETSAEGRFFGVNRVGIGVLRKVEQEVCCYVPGEVSRIENIMAREYKERSTRSLISTETTTEETTELEIDDQSDTASTTRNELATEIANQLSKQSSINTGASLGVQTKLGPATITADGNFDYASSTSAVESDSQAQTYAEELTTSAQQKVTQKTTQKRTSKILSEFEENNRHGYDNRKGDRHVTGVYRWVDIIYVNRIVNYGKRLMYEFLVPEPARFYKQAIEEKAAADAGTGGGDSTQDQQPKSPADNGVKSPDDITADNYLELGRLYGVSLPDPVTPTEDTISKSFGPGDDPDGDVDPDTKPRSYQFKMDFAMSGLDQYVAHEVTTDFNFDYQLKTGFGHTETGTYFILKVYNDTFTFDRSNLPDSPGTSRRTSANKQATRTTQLPDLKDGLSLSVDIKNVYNFAINLVVKLQVDEQVMIDWRNTVFDAIMKAYDSQLEDYRKAQRQSEKRSEAKKNKTKGGSPQHNRTVEQRELQRLAIEMLMRPFGLAQGGDFYTSVECKVPQVEQTRRWEVYSSRVKFFEQAFDWELMSYLFYPYYWAKKCDWADLLQESDSNDRVFAAFLQSGMARMVIPVRRGFELAMTYYMDTGDIWNGGGIVLDTDDDLYLSIAEELEEVEGVVGREWQTRVPTTLTIIQGDSVFLEDQGLPCCDRVEQAGVDTRIRPSTALLGGTPPSAG